MVKLIPKKKSNDVVAIGKNHKIAIGEDSKVKEMLHISSGGSFSSLPMLTLGAREPARLPSNERKQLIDECYRLWKYDPLGGTIVSLTTYFVLGRGLIFQFDDENAQFHAKKFYLKNDFEMKLRRSCDEGTAHGENFFWLRPKFEDIVYQGSTIWRQGDTQITPITPENIIEIAVADDDPSNVYSYTYEYVDSNGINHSITIPDISKYSLDGSEKEKGCIVHVKFNAGNMDAFGHSDLIRIKEWLDNYQEYLRDGVIINKLYRSPCFDISIKDAGQDEIDAAAARYRNWQIGSNPVHNDNEVWQVLEFTGPNTSSESARRALLLIVAAGVGFAEYMLADGANANLASSKSQQLPVIKKFEDRQDIYAYHLQKIFQFALYIKASVGYDSKLDLQYDQEGDFMPFEGTIEFPTIAQEKDVEVAQTNEKAILGGYMSLRTACSRLGLNYDREMAQLQNDQPLIKRLQGLGINIQIGQPKPEPKPNVDSSKNN